MTSKIEMAEHLLDQVVTIAGAANIVGGLAHAFHNKHTNLLH